MFSQMFEKEKTMLISTAKPLKQPLNVWPIA
jgi:hypothetical protein